MSDELIFRYPAKVIKPTKRQREALASKLAQLGDSSILDEYDPFYWTAEISNNQVDSYYTWMMDSTLTNFVNDSIAGVGFLNSHRHDELPFGRSLDARFDGEGERHRVLTDFYTLPGLNLNGVKTDDIIAGIRSGIVSDVSVGFHGGEWWCDVCGGNYRDYQSCQHWAGMKIETKGGMVTVTVAIDGARLSEVSAVFDGATPDATILKAQRAAADGELEPKLRATLETRYRTRLPERMIFAGVDTRSVVEEKTTMDFEKLVNDLRSSLGLDENADLVATVTTLASQAESAEAERSALAGKLEEATSRVGELEAEAAELRIAAEDGKTYRVDLIEDALSNGVRAFGNNFERKTYEDMLKASPINVIKRMRDDWAVVGDAAFEGGRKSQDNGEAPASSRKRKMNVPESAYRA